MAAREKAWRARSGTEFAKYRNDPVGFARDILHHEYTPEIQAVMASLVSSRVTIAKSANAVGKTFGAADIALWWLMVYDDAGVRITSAPPETNLRDTLWRYMLRTIAEHPETFADVERRDLLLRRSDAAMIRGVPIPQAADDREIEERFRGKHFAHQLFIVDEGNAVPDPVYSGIEACMSGTHERQLVMFNPANDAGPVADMERNGRGVVIEISALTHPNVTTGDTIIPGAVSRETVIQRMNMWTRPATNEDKDTFDVPDRLVGITAVGPDGREFPPIPPGARAITDERFSYMVLARYPLGGVHTVFDGAYLRSIQALCPLPERTVQSGQGGYNAPVTIWEEPDPYEEYGMCVDPHGGMTGDNLDYTSAHVVNLATGNMAAAYHGRMETHQAAADLSGLSAYYNGAVILVLSTGVGLAVLKMLEEDGANLWREERERRVNGERILRTEAGFPASREKLLVEETVRLVSLAAKGFDVRMKINDPQTIEEMAHYVELPNGKRGAEGKYHDDRVLSWCGCAWLVVKSGMTPEQRAAYDESLGGRLDARRNAMPSIDATPQRGAW